MSDRPPARFHCGEQDATSWWRRAEACAELLARLPASPGQRTSIADIGCGDQKLRDCLRARGLPFEYRGYDLHPQASDVVTFDVRTEALPQRHTVAVLLGVIEYLPDLATTLRRLAQAVPAVLVSHVVREGSQYSAARLAELGWLNHLTTAELERLLGELGLDVIDRQSTPDQRTLLLLCARRQRASAG
jgi:hypothetical protein